MPRTQKPAAPPPPPPEDADEQPEDELEETEPEAEPDVEVIVAAEVEEEEEEADDDDDEDVAADEDLVDEVEIAKPAAPVRPAGRPSPGRPPGAKEEPDPPYYVGERIRLIQTTRPRTSVPIGDYPMGALGRVETVLSMTCIIRFDIAPDTKEVVAFQCIESIDDEAKARRAERDALKAAEGAGL